MYNLRDPMSGMFANQEEDQTTRESVRCRHSPEHTTVSDERTDIEPLLKYKTIICRLSSF